MLTFSFYHFFMHSSTVNHRFVNGVRFSAPLFYAAGSISQKNESADILFTASNEEVTEENLDYIYTHKTGKLLLAPVAIASILGDNQSYLPLESFGRLLGRLFQMTDDILDVVGTSAQLGKTVGKDEKENKLTCVKLYGLEGAQVRADMCAKDCLAVLEGVDGDTEFLKALVDYVLKRSN